MTSTDTAGEGHNSGGIAGAQLKSIVERVERLDEEIADLNVSKKEIYQESRSNGFDVAAIKTVIKMRKQDAAERQEREAIVDLYWNAVGGK